MMNRTFPVMEIFGPTIQGEGLHVGRQTMFIRFGGCDYRCEKCDSMHAVEPESVRKGAQKLTAKQIVAKVENLQNAAGSEVPWVTLSGGNPVLHDLEELVAMLHNRGYAIAVETQGSVWKDWLQDCESVTISPKGPGLLGAAQFAKMGQTKSQEFTLSEIYKILHMRPGFSWKIVIFSEADLDFAEWIKGLYPMAPMFLSVGNPFVSGEVENHQDVLYDAYEQIMQQVFKRPTLSDAIILPQLHVLLWGNKLGV